MSEQIQLASKSCTFRSPVSFSLSQKAHIRTQNVPTCHFEAPTAYGGLTISDITLLGINGFFTKGPAVNRVSNFNHRSKPRSQERSSAPYRQQPQLVFEENRQTPGKAAVPAITLDPNFREAASKNMMIQGFTKAMDNMANGKV